MFINENSSLLATFFSVNDTKLVPSDIQKSCEKNATRWLILFVKIMKTKNFFVEILQKKLHCLYFKTQTQVFQQMMRDLIVLEILPKISQIFSVAF